MASTSAEAKHASATQEWALSALATQVQQLTSLITKLTSISSPSALTPLLSASASPRPASKPRIGPFECYTGEPEGCSPFLTKYSIFYALKPITLAFEEGKVVFTIHQMTGKARLWGTVKWDRQTSACASFDSFSAELCKVFGRESQPTDARGLLCQCQEDQSVFDFSIDFCTKSRS